MLRIQATIGLTTYYFASEALDYADRYWEPRISNAFQISREFNSADKSGNKIRTVDVSLDNRDGFFNSIYTADGLVNGKFVLYFNEGDNNVKTFTGRVNKINSFGDDVSLTIREVGYEYLTRKFPDAQIAYDYYSTSGINESWNAIPIHLGTVNRYPCPWVNLFYSHFIIGSGPIHAVKKIYFDKTVVYDSSTGQNGYKPTPESPEIKFRIFKGARAGQTDIVDGITSPYPGFAFIQLYKIVNSVEEPADPVNPDGEAVQIYVDIEGLQNEAGNAPERNPAQILYQFFTKPYTAEEGYGLAIPSGDLDFASAITECAIQGFKIDGSIDNTTDFGEWIDEILRCCRGQLYETGGKISVRIDAAAASPTIHFDETGELGYNCIVDTWNEPERDAQTNRVRLSYSWNFENSNFNKKPSYNQESPLGDTHLQNATHAARIQKWNTETLEYKLIKDDTTAHKLAQYYLNNIVKQLITTSLTTEVDIPNTVDAGTVVKVTSPKFGWSEKQFRITSISRSEENTEIQLKEYDASIFTFYDPGTGAETSDNQYSVYNIPNKPEMSSLAVVNELLADGSTQTRVNVTFVKPTENAQFIALYYKLSSEPESSFRILDTTTDATQMSVIWKGIESGVYNFRLAAISSVGIYSDLGVVSGDKHYYGQPNAEATITMTGDTIAPGTPTITNLTPTLGGVAFTLEIAGGVPSDFSHFEIYRTVGTGSEAIIDNNHTTLLFTDNERMAAYEGRKYAAIAVDKTGNKSSKSTISGSTVPLKIDTADIFAGAITSETITSNAIYGKCFMTNCNVGSGVAGVIFDSAGIRAYSTTANTFNMDAATGNVSMTGAITATSGFIGGFCADPTEGLYAGAGATRVQMKAGAGFWAGATAKGDAPFSVNQAGALKSTSGCIGGWTIAGTYIGNVSANGWTALNSECRAIYNHKADHNYGEFLGQIFNNSNWTGRYGLAVTRGVGVYLFRSDTDINGANACNQIAGWDFTSEFLCKSSGESTVKLMSGDYVGRTGLEVYSSLMSISIGHCLHHPNVAYCAMDGILIADASAGNLFKVGKYHSDCSLVAQIAGWNFNASCLYSLIGSYGQMRLDSSNRTIWMFPDSSGASRFTLGQCIYTFDTWKSVDMGLALTGAACENLFTVWGCCGVTCAQIAGWNFNAENLRQGAVLLGTDAGYGPHLRISADGGPGNTYTTIGKSIFNGAWHTENYGIAVRVGGNNLFQVHSCCDGSNLVAQIAGWNFDQYSLWKSTSAWDARLGYPGIYIGTCHDGVTHNGAGFRYVAGSTAYPTGDLGVSIGSVLLHPNVAWCDRKGIMIASASNGILFRADTDANGDNPFAQIAGWCFDCKMFKTGTFGCGPSFIISRENTGSGYFYLGQQVLQGYSMIWHHGSNAGHLVIGQIAADAATIKTDYYGLQMMDHASNEFFALAAKQGYACYEPYNRIAGWVFDAGNIYKIYGDSRVQMSSAVGSVHRYVNSNANYGEFLGQIYNNGWTGRYGIAVTRGIGNYYFRADTDINGANYCSQIAGWDFNATQIYSTGCGLILCATGAIQTGDFVTGNKGWRIDCNGNAEFNNICARGAIRTAVFIKDQISVVGGCTLIRPAGVTCLPNYACSNYSFVFESTEQFNIGDIIRVKDGLNDWWGTVHFKNDHAVNATFNSGINGWYHQAGQAVVNYGPANSGGIMLNGQAPYIDLYTHDGTPWNGTCSRVRMGNLNGWGDISSNVYGIAIGSPTGNYLRYDATSSELKLRGVMNIQAGSTVPSSLLNNFSISCNYCQWTCAGGYDSRFIYCGMTMPDGTTAAGDTLIASYNSEVLSDLIEIDPTQAYKVTLSVWASVSTGVRYFGFTAFDKNGAEVPVDHFDSAGNFAGHATNPYFWYGSTSGWTELEGYIMPSSTWQENIPKGKNVFSNFRFPASTKYIRLRYLNYYNNGVQSTAQFYSPSIVPVSVEGAYKVNRGLSANGTLISSVAPACNAAPSGAGLYLGANVMGYYDGGTWKSYMDNSGRFYLSGSTGGLAWDGSALTVCGTVCSCAGSIGGWNICDGYLYGTNQAGTSGIWLIKSGDGGNPLISVIGDHTGCLYHTFGGNVFNGSWLYGHWGMVLRVNSQNLFQVHSRADGTCQCAQIAGWDFTSNCLSKDDGTGKTLISSDNNSLFTWHCASGIVVTHGRIHDNSNWTNRYGLAVHSAVGRLFEASSGCTQIAGWDFNSYRLQKISGTAELSMLSSKPDVGITNPYIWIGNNAGDNHVTIGGAHYASVWTQGKYGIQVVSGTVPVFTAYACCDGTGGCFQIANWNFTRDALSKGVTGGSVCLMACESVYGRTGLEIAGASTYISIGSCLHYPGHAICAMTGMMISDINNGVFFKVGQYHSDNSIVAQIAGWNFTNSYMCSGGIVINSSGEIYSTNYSAGSAGWCINGSGNAEFNNVTVRGTVCASQGCIGCFNLVNGCLTFNNGVNYGYMSPTYYCLGNTHCGMLFVPDVMVFNAGCPNEYSSEIKILNSCTPKVCVSSFEVGSHLYCGSELYSDCLLLRQSIVGTKYVHSNYSAYGFKINCDHYNSNYTSEIIAQTNMTGDISANAPFLVCVYCSNSYYAMCTNGRIQASGFIGTSSSSNMLCHDDPNRDATYYKPNSYTRSFITQFVVASSVGTGGNYAGVITFAPWDGTYSTGDASYQLVFGSAAANASGIPILRIRNGIDTTWNGFYDILHSGNTKIATSDANSPVDVNNITCNGFYYANANVSLYGQTDGAIYNQAYSTNWQGQIYQDYRTGQLAVRGKCNGGWTGWLCIATNRCPMIACSAGASAFTAIGSSCVVYVSSGSVGICAEAGVSYAIKACVYGCYGVYATASCCYGVVGCVVACYGVLGCAALSGVYGVATTAYPVAGNGAYYNASTRTLKQNFEDVCVLSGLRSLCIQKWTWADINQRGFDEFIAPPAEDVASAFGLTFKDDGYYTLDGIALKAAQEIDENVQVIDQNVQVHDTCIEFLKDENISLKSCIEQMSCKMKMIEERLGIN